SPQTTGDDQPRSCSGVFHLMFFVSLHVVGRPVELVQPSARGPRKRGHVSSASDERESDGRTRKIKQAGRRARRAGGQCMIHTWAGWMRAAIIIRCGIATTERLVTA